MIQKDLLTVIVVAVFSVVVAVVFRSGRVIVIVVFARPVFCHFMLLNLIMLSPKFFLMRNFNLI